MAQPFKIDIVDADHFAAVDVDDLSVDQVLLEEEVIFVTAQGAEGGGGTQFKGAGGGFHDLVGGDDLEALTGFEDQAGNAAGFCPGGHGDVFETTADVALRVRHRGAEHGGQAYAGCGAGAHGWI